MVHSIFDFPCGVLSGKKLIKSHEKALGIEVEMEPVAAGTNFVLDANPVYWTFKADGSLRNGGLEMVSCILTSSGDYNNALEEARSSVQWNLLSSTSPRTSVHVHVNFNNRPYLEVITMYSLYILLEDILTKYCGHSREGNIFAIESSKGLYVHEKLKKTIEEQQIKWIDGNYRYSNLNFASLPRFGTLEFRSMRGLTDVDSIKAWVGIITEMRDFCRGKTPKDLDLLFNTNPISLVPTELLSWCTKNKFNWIDAMTSQYSLFYDMVASHPTEWNMKDPQCDFRNEPGFLEAQGLTEKTSYQAHRDSYIRFIKNKENPAALFSGGILARPDFEQPEPVLRGVQVGQIQPVGFQAVDFVNAEWRLGDALEQARMVLRRGAQPPEPIPNVWFAQPDEPAER